MKVSVWDTYVTRSDRKIMHFDILVPQELNNQDEIYKYGSEVSIYKENFFLQKE